MKSLSRVQLLATPGTAAYQAPLSMGFSRQEYWSGVPLPSPFTCSDVSKSLPPPGLEPTKLLYPWDFPDKNTEVGCNSLLEGTFGTQGLNPGLREGELKCFIRVQLLGWTCIH